MFADPAEQASLFYGLLFLDAQKLGSSDASSLSHTNPRHTVAAHRPTAVYLHDAWNLCGILPSGLQLM
jgi:hypothetical protein